MTLTVPRGVRTAVLTNSASARSRRRSVTRIYQSHMAPHHCGVQEALLASGPTYVDSSSHQIQTMIGIYAVTARSKSIAMFSAFDPATKAAITRYGSTFHSSMLGWSTNTVLATLSAARKTGDKARRGAILTTTFDHSHCVESAQASRTPSRNNIRFFTVRHPRYFAHRFGQKKNLLKTPCLPSVFFVFF